MNQLKTIEEMNEMPLNELENYTNIREYRKEMANDRVLLNSNVIDIPLLTNGEEE